MKTSLVITLAILSILLVACGSTSTIPFGRPGASVSTLQGEWTFNFFGGDVDPYRSGLGDQTLTERRRLLIEAFFRKNPQVAPPNCTYGIELLYGQDGLGYSWVVFKCKTQKAGL
jgi:hypothetical protein